MILGVWEHVLLRVVGTALVVSGVWWVACSDLEMAPPDAPNIEAEPLTGEHCGGESGE